MNFNREINPLPTSEFSFIKLLFNWNLLLIVLMLLLGKQLQAANNDALRFDGVDDYILNPSNYNLIGDRTFSFWIKKTDGRNEKEEILFKENIFEIAINNKTGKLIVQWGNGKNWEYIVESNTKIRLNKWIHVVVAKSYESHTTTIYFNGKEDKQIATSNTIASNNAPFLIGGCIERSVSINNFSGAIKEVQIWNRIFTKNYINQKIQSNSDLTEMGLVGYYQLNNNKIIHKNGFYKIAISEFEGLDGIVINKPLIVRSDELTNNRVSTDIYEKLANINQYDFYPTNTDLNKSSINSDLGASIDPAIGNNNFNLSIKKDNANFFKINVYDILGESIFTSDFFIGQQGQEFGSDLAPGVYRVDVLKGTSVQRIKVLKQ